MLSFLLSDPPLQELLDGGLLLGGGVGGMVSCEKVSLDRDTRLLRRDRGGGVGAGLMSPLRTDCRDWDLSRGTLDKRWDEINKTSYRLRVLGGGVGPFLTLRLVGSDLVMDRVCPASASSSSLSL